MHKCGDHCRGTWGQVCDDYDAKRNACTHPVSTPRLVAGWIEDTCADCGRVLDATPDD